MGCGSKRSGEEADFSDGSGGLGSGDDGFGGSGGMGSNGGLSTVYFDFDRWEIRDDARGSLQENASAIKSRSEWGSVTIEGHCDERGSEEYNLALGEKRANSVKRYLANLGVSEGKLTTVSYGESQPAVQGHDESAWRYNRRAEFRVSR